MSFQTPPFSNNNNESNSDNSDASDTSDTGLMIKKTIT